VRHGGPEASLSLLPLSPTITSRDLGQPRQRREGWRQKSVSKP